MILMPLCYVSLDMIRNTEPLLPCPSGLFTQHLVKWTCACINSKLRDLFVFEYILFVNFIFQNNSKCLILILIGSVIVMIQLLTGFPAGGCAASPSAAPPKTTAPSAIAFV